MESSSLIAGKFGGECAYLHVPAIVSSAELADALRREPIIQANFAQLDRCTKALFVAGNVTEENPLIRAGVITAEEMTDFRRKGAVGVICGRFMIRRVSRWIPIRMPASSVSGCRSCATLHGGFYRHR